MSDIPDQIGSLMIGLGIYVDREYTRYSGLAPDKHIGLMARYIDGIREGIDRRADVNSDYLDDIGNQSETPEDNYVSNRDRVDYLLRLDLTGTASPKITDTSKCRQKRGLRLTA
jgi:hypothetical protein